MMTTKKIAAACGLSLLLIILWSGYTAFAGSCEQVRQSTLRLHIVAHSDSEEDQALKLALRDAVLNQYAPRLAELRPEQAADTAQELCADIEQAAQSFVREQGCETQVTAALVDMYFDTSHYDGYTLPAGRYKALRLSIGKAAGQNWWCVMYPPLCIPAASEGQALALTQNIEALSQPVVYKPAFAVVEAVEKINELLRETS